MTNINDKTFAGKTVMITGGTGSWGQTLVYTLLKTSVGKIVIFSRGELRQVEMRRAIPDSRLKFTIGDVRDFEAVRSCILDNEVEFLYHLAALKHVPICEDQPEEAIKTNILGTTNLIKACKYSTVEKFILISTDKAVDPINTYGMTKGLVERLVIHANLENPNTEFLCVRAGNVLGSNGSFVPYFRQCVKTGTKVQVTDLKMTRFFLTLDKVMQLLLFATEQGYGGEIYVTKMLSFTLETVVEALCNQYEVCKDFIQEIGAKPGEKIHEVLISESELKRVVEMGDVYIIKPNVSVKYRMHIWEYEEFRQPCTLTKAYSSKDNTQDAGVFLALLKEGGLL